MSSRPCLGVAARRSLTRRFCRDERGGAIALMVILVTPMLVLAAIAAAAVPQRLAAQIAFDDSAVELAAMAAIWRDDQARPHGPLEWFFPDCAAADLDADASDSTEHVRSSDGEGADPAPSHNATPADGLALRQTCHAATGSLFGGLGGLGIDADRLAGYHTSLFSASRLAGGNDDHPPSVPCHTARDAVAADAVQLGISAPWTSAGWASAQIWPDGDTLEALAIGRLIEQAPPASARSLPDCALLGEPHSRRIADQAATRTAFGHPGLP